MRLRQNKRPDKLIEAIREPDKFDKQRFAENQDRDLDQVFRDLQQVRLQVEEWILEFSESELNNQRRYHWLKGKAIKDIVAAATFERELKVVPQMALFAQQWLMHKANICNDAIPLIPINMNIEENNHDDAN